MGEERPHRKLLLWQKALELVVEVYRLTGGFPAMERFGLAGQMQRAAVSIPSNIAEGAARRGRKEYLQFLFIARGSLSELDTQLEIAVRLGYIDAAAGLETQARLDELSRMLSGLIRSLSQ
jgi:four helix bundle protein